MNLGVKVTDFAWSHDGRMALICYRDGFVLVGSVAGQRYWSSMLNLDTTSITCGIWSADDQEVMSGTIDGQVIVMTSTGATVMFGTTDGQVIVMSSTGAMVRQFTVHEGNEILAMAWSCEKFNMEEVDNKDSDSHRRLGENNTILAICFKFGDIFLVNGYDDVCPFIIHTSLQGLKMEWSNCGQYLAVGGFTRLPNLQCHNELHFYSREGRRIHWVTIPSQGKPLTALTWGHNDKRLFVAAGCQLYVAWVSKQVAPLHFLCSRVVHRSVRHEKNADLLPLPHRIRQGVQSLFSPTVKSYVPDPFKLRGFVSTPPPGNERLFCTMIRHGEETSGGHYTLYLEYLGGLVPLLKGKRASKLRPDFVIFDPKIKTSGKGQNCPSSLLQTDSSSESEADVVTDGCGSPRMQRRRRQKVFRAEKVERSITFRTLDELLYNDNLPETNKLVDVTSNIWGTKFHITGVSSYLPRVLGSVVYKTSLLHLQPRQMTIHLQEVSGSTQPLAKDPNFTPAGVSDEDEESTCWPCREGEAPEGSQNTAQSSSNSSMQVDNSWSDKLVTSQVCCVDVQTPNSATVTPVHVPSITTNSSGTLEETGCVFVSDSDSNGNNNNNNNGGGGGHGLGVGGGGVSSLSPTHLTTSSSSGIRSRSLSPVQDSSTQTSTVAFNGEVTALSNKDVCSPAQGARPKVKKTYQPKRPSTVRALSSSATSTTTTTTYANKSVTSTQTGTYSSTTHSSASSSPLSALPSDLTDTELTCSPVSPEPEIADILKRISSGGGEGGTRWADLASHSIRYIDEDATDSSEAPYESNLVADSSSSTSSSVILKRRLYLAQGMAGAEEGCMMSHSEDSSPQSEGKTPRIRLDCVSLDRDSPVEESRTEIRFDLNSAISSAVQVSGLLSTSCVRGSNVEILHSASLPSSPIHGPSKSETPTRRMREEVLKSQCRHPSPVLGRKGRLDGLDSLDDELVLTVMEDFKGGKSYRNLETFQKAQLKHKLRRVQGGMNGGGGGGQLVMHNKAPLWNENSQVYQLDFGGRVTQESAKNFQIELQSKQVMQFGRIDSNAYTLDFQYPFTALQAFAVALANVTQRLK
ncbi:hypothetical protein ACOMHN_001824 [Nucella lapillus]